MEVFSVLSHDNMSQEGDRLLQYVTRRGPIVTICHKKGTDCYNMSQEGDLLLQYVTRRGPIVTICHKKGTDCYNMSQEGD